MGRLLHVKAELV